MVERFKYLLGILFSFTVFFSCNTANAQIIVAPPPPPTPTTHNPVIIIPGFLGSFNANALFKDKSGGVWSWFPFYNIYAGLVARFEVAGYVKNHDVFVAYYDWRHPNKQSAEEFLAPIIAQAKEQTGQVDIVAHSMGGLLAQAYMDSDDYAPGEIGKFVMLGTPNKGASEAYLPWEGGVLPKTWDWLFRGYVNWIEGNLKIANHKQDIQNPAGYRLFFPSLQELLPSVPFISKDGGDATVSGVDTNPLLQSLHDNLANIINDGVDITTIAGSGGNTLGTVALAGDPTPEDNALDRWRDGHPVEEVPLPNTDQGDETVLQSSALLGQNDIVVDGVTHIQLPEHAQNQILEALGIEDSNPQQFIYQAPKSLLGLAVLSPVSVAITGPDGKIVSAMQNDYGDDAYVSISSEEGADPANSAGDDPKVIILQNVPEGKYNVQLTGTGTGEYHVVFTYGNDANQELNHAFTGTTNLGKQESFTVTISDDGAEVSKIKRDDPDDDSDDDAGHHPKGNKPHKKHKHGLLGGLKYLIRK